MVCVLCGAYPICNIETCKQPTYIKIEMERVQANFKFLINVSKNRDMEVINTPLRSQPENRVQIQHIFSGV